MRHVRVFCGIAATTLLLLPFAVHAQTDNSGVDEAQDTIDEITVMGARSLASLRAEVIEAEQVVYDLFNEFNDDDGYDIICKKETRIGSQIPRRICLLRMYREAVSEATTDDGYDIQLPVGNMTGDKRHQEVLIEKMRVLAIEHPELLDALRTRLQIETKFEEEREKRFGD